MQSHPRVHHLRQFSDAQPFLQGTESLSLGGLGILTTNPVPGAAQGFQLGGRTIHRIVETNKIQLEGAFRQQS